MIPRHRVDVLRCFLKKEKQSGTERTKSVRLYLEVTYANNIRLVDVTNNLSVAFDGRHERFWKQAIAFASTEVDVVDNSYDGNLRLAMGFTGPWVLRIKKKYKTSRADAMAEGKREKKRRLEEY